MRSARDTPPVPLLQPVDEPAPAGPERSERSLTVKHALDRIGAAMLIVLAAPVLAAAALAARLFSQGPVLIRDRRIDRHGRSFELLSFPPLAFMRRWSLDRLPELFNVVRGQMSFVGPRPERPEFVELFGENLLRHDQPRCVKPGITGWAQVRGLEGRAPLAERVSWDDFYVENWSLWLDLKIVLLTLYGIWRDAERG